MVEGRGRAVKKSSNGGVPAISKEVCLTTGHGRNVPGMLRKLPGPVLGSYGCQLVGLG